MSELARCGAGLLNAELKSAQDLRGGDLSQLVRIELADGRVAVVKGGANPKAEAEMLSVMAAAGVPTPSVLAVNAQALVLSWVEGNGEIANAWADVGRVCRRLHDHHSVDGQYGWPQDFCFGPVRIQNRPSARWPSFWANYRLAPFLDKIPASLAVRIESLCSQIDERLPSNPRASLLHGDLWTGNLMLHDKQVSALIDPACYYGDGEVDVAMLQLFGQPSAAFFAHYGALEPGAEQRLAIYRLWPALAHYALFGTTYRPLLEQQLDLAAA